MPAGWSWSGEKYCPMNQYRYAPAVVAIVALLCVARADAMINPRFTPIHLMQEADLIFAGPLELTNEAMVWKLSVATTVKGKLSVATTVKGKPAATVTVSLASCNKDHLEQIQRTLKDNRDNVLVFVDSKAPEKRGRMHVMGQWLNVTLDGNGHVGR